MRQYHPKKFLIKDRHGGTRSTDSNGEATQLVDVAPYDRVLYIRADIVKIALKQAKEEGKKENTGEILRGLLGR